MTATVEVRFKGIRKGYYRWPEENGSLRVRSPVVVEAERGLDLGYISAVGELAAKKCGSCTGCAVGDTAPPAEAQLAAVVRVAGEGDVRQAEDLRRGEDEIRRRVAERARSHGLTMKVSDAEWQWDRKKLTVYFTAEHRVDFRALVRELAAQYHTRIELRQIGVRDEAARLTGVGRCGREYCCSTWLTELSPISLSLAKDQHLSLNPAQISGGCGRLLCCLRYEHDFYLTQRKRFPKEGKTLRTARGAEKVVAVDIFRERVFLRNEEQGPRTVALVDLQAELETAAAALPTPEPRPQEPPVPAAPSEPSVATPAAEGERKKRRRRRRRRRDGPGDAGPSEPVE